MKILKICGYDFQFDDDFDLSKITKHRWRVVPNNLAAYRRIRFRGKSVAISIGWDVIGIPPIGLEVDHIDHNRLNNQRSNLRFCTKSQNICNQRRRNKTGFKGVGKTLARLQNPWRATIKIKGVRIFLGYFPTPEQASEAYQAAAKFHFGEFACCETMQ